MILTGRQILESKAQGRIRIDPWSDDQLNPNSYNLRLGDDLAVYTEPELDMAKPNGIEFLKIPAEGMVLRPGRLYLGRTQEYTETHGMVPMLEGRSSVGRLGLFVHVTAGFGDIGFCGFAGEPGGERPFETRLFPTIHCIDRRLEQAKAVAASDCKDDIADGGDAEVADLPQGSDQSQAVEVRLAVGGLVRAGAFAAL